MWYTIKDNQVKLQITVKPNARKSAIIKITDQSLHIAIHAKPYKGEANEALLVFLSKTFDIPKSLIILKSGQCSKYKQTIMPFTMNVRKILHDLLLFK